MPTLALAFALLAQMPEADQAPAREPCRFEYGYAIPESDPDVRGRWFWMDDNSNPFLYPWQNVKVYHALEGPSAPRPFESIGGHAVRLCVAHYDDVAILGRMTPEDFAMAAAVEGFVDEAVPARPRSYHDMLVVLGFASDSCVTRDVAQRILEDHGVRAIGALLRGLRSKDAEVRHRCRLALGEIRDGLPPEDDD